MRAEDLPQGSARLPRTYEWGVYLVAALVTASGLLWLLFEHFVRNDQGFGPEHHWLQHWWLVAHGVLAMAAVWGFGVLWPIHVRRAWRQCHRRCSGGSVFTLLATLVISGLLLYYCGDDRTRGWISLGHWTLGLATALALAVHAGNAVRGRRPKGDAHWLR